ncbi:type IA DNA topoisomerase [Marinococcus luteus]|uniref:type IA DNA topoisomerase n=1 Tax=Marinococcus luteus TaxID=1122204 RepID=UPI002ACC5EC4|nr:DNA topoisomerase 3 [Marinococcus luteus]MDZ5784323.1 DNA topoisomerase 3 [Marinococcus luteus]
MPVILAEKPSQAKAYAAAFQIQEKKDGYMRLKPCSLFPDGAVLTWGFGHLLELRAPADYESSWKKWSLDTLPMLPVHFRFKPNPRAFKQLKIVKQMLQEADSIIIATDCDREGENIARSVIDYTKTSHKPTRRLWINSLEKDEVYKGFEQLREGADYLPLYEEARARQFSDWIVGMNASRLYTLLLKQKGINEVFSVGRVQTPTLKLIYDRQKEIEAFEPEPYWELEGTFRAEAGEYKGKYKKRFGSKEEVLRIWKEHGLKKDTEGTISSIKKEEKQEKPPLLHSLSSLQTTMNKKYKMSPSAVLKTVQSLYDEPLKVVSYPRTDTRHITSGEFNYLKGNLSRMQESMNASFEPVSTTPSKRFVDGSKVQEHHAIIPTKKVLSQTQFEKLNRAQQQVYKEVLNSVLAMFHRNYVYEETTVETDVQGLIFESKGRVDKQLGWKELFPSPKKKKEQEESTLPPVTEGEQVEAYVQAAEKETQPPKPYTEGQLINMMKSCGKWIEDDETSKKVLQETEGLGTEATRSTIIQTLQKQEYIRIQKNIVEVTAKGWALCEVVEGTLLSKPLLTAKWEAFLKQIGSGEADKEAFLKQTEAFTKKLVEEAPAGITNMQTDPGQVASSKKQPQRTEPIALCPVCQKGQMMERKSFYGCSEYANGCKFTVPKTLLKKRITQAQVKKLCEKGETQLIKGFKGKKPFDAKLKRKENGVEFVFPAKDNASS